MKEQILAKIEEMYNDGYDEKSIIEAADGYQFAYFDEILNILKGIAKKASPLEKPDLEKLSKITKNIETKSNGLIIIKQPTLYTVLKKLEKSKFIASYWEDSEIGGKRHYYKLTEYGKLQVSTLPPYQELIKAATEEPVEEEIETPSQNEPISPIETILPTEEVFASNDIDNITEAEINSSNSALIRNEEQTKEEEFAKSTVVLKFTETTITTAPQISVEQNASRINDESINNVTPAKTIEEDIKYVDYVNFKTDKVYIAEKKLNKNKGDIYGR